MESCGRLAIGLLPMSSPVRKAQHAILPHTSNRMPDCLGLSRI